MPKAEFHLALTSERAPSSSNWDDKVCSACHRNANCGWVNHRRAIPHQCMEGAWGALTAEDPQGWTPDLHQLPDVVYAGF